MYIAGYRLAMLVGGAGSLWLASYLGVETYKQSVWMIVYIAMGALMFIGILTTLLSIERFFFIFHSRISSTLSFFFRILNTIHFWYVSSTLLDWFAFAGSCISSYSSKRQD